MAFDPRTLEILACPDCKKDLLYCGDGGTTYLLCSGCGLRFEIKDDIPILLIPEA